MFFFRIFKKDMNHQERITLIELAHMISMADPITISVETLRIESECYFEK